MDKDFQKLFLEVSADNAKRDERWAGIEAFAGDYNRSKAEVLVRLAFRTKPPAGGYQDSTLEQTLIAFHKAFSDIDPSYEPAPRQDQVLAAATLVRLFDTNAGAATAVTTTACGGARKAELPIDLVNLAENSLSRLSATNRTRLDLSELKLELPELTLGPEFAKLEPSDPKSLKSVLEEFRSTVDNALYELCEEFNTVVSTLVEANKKADEELDMLAWSFGGRALLPDRAFADVADAQKPLILARDLASLTTIDPGPAAVPALLSRAGVKTTGKLPVEQAVNAVSDEWTNAVLKGRNVSPACTPLHFALAKRQETGAGDGWTTGWAAITGIDKSTRLSPLGLSTLFYREVLWLR